MTDDKFATGHFYASNNPTSAVGDLTDQGEIDKTFYNEAFQENAYQAINSFIKA